MVESGAGRVPQDCRQRLTGQSPRRAGVPAAQQPQARAGRCCPSVCCVVQGAAAAAAAGLWKRGCSVQCASSQAVPYRLVVYNRSMVNGCLCVCVCVCGGSCPGKGCPYCSWLVGLCVPLERGGVFHVCIHRVLCAGRQLHACTGTCAASDEPPPTLVTCRGRRVVCRQPPAVSCGRGQ